ncbi:hypothetical protein SUGI_0697670 [Cryptomeria japonica]|nr:hypothetical protein SUGI_0697670 [Cryptomeria japonica]
MCELQEEIKIKEEKDADPHRDIFGWLKDQPIVDLSHMELTNSGYDPGVVSRSDGQKAGGCIEKKKMPLRSPSDSSSGFGYGSQMNTPTVMGQHITSMDTNNSISGVMNIDSLLGTASEMERSVYLNIGGDLCIESSFSTKIMKKIQVEPSSYQPMIACKPSTGNSRLCTENNLLNSNWNWNWNARSSFNPNVFNTHMAPVKDSAPARYQVNAEEDFNIVANVKSNDNSLSFLTFDHFSGSTRTVKKRRNVTRVRKYSGSSSSHSFLESRNLGLETAQAPISPLLVASNTLDSGVAKNGSVADGSGSDRSFKRQRALDRPAIEDPVHKEKEKEHENKNLKFLLQKELRNSDVGSLGRIVLPKKEAEANLPTLTAREGIQICMEDMHLSKKWNFKYRFWPNNKSRMYVMENTGDFVKTHGLQLGDFVMLYKDEVNDNYIIRAKKSPSQLTPGSSGDKSGVYGSSTLLDDGSIHQSGSEKENEDTLHWNLFLVLDLMRSYL